MIVGITIVLFLSTHMAADVPPVTNVTLTCHNFNNVLYWNYSDSSLAPSFRVKIGTFYNSNKLPLIDSPNRQADVSFLNDKDEYYSLTVTAVIGGNQSDPSPKITFSYYTGFSGQICSLDLPRVNVTVLSDHKVAVRFPHPSHSYPQMQTRKRSLLDFTYQLTLISVSPENLKTTTVYDDCICNERVCEESFPVEESGESHCVRIDGLLGKVAVLATQDYCFQAVAGPHPTKYVLLYIVCPLLACVVCLVSWMLYQKLTSGKLPLPAFMPFRSKGKPPLTVERAALSPVLSVSPGVTPLLPAKEREEFPHFDAQTEPEVRRPIGVTQPDRSLSSGPEEGLRDGYESGSVLDVGQEGDEEVEVAEDDCGSSWGYERHNPVIVQMAPGDPVKGYRG